MNMSKVTINGVEYTAKYSLRALFLYERMTGNNGFETKSTEDSFKFMFCMVKANNDGCTMSWDEFLDYVEADPAIAVALSAILNQQISEMNALGTPKKEGDGEDTKKK